MSHQQQLKHRSAASTNRMNNSDINDVAPRSGTGLSAQSMMKASPTQYGSAWKLHVPLFYGLLPIFLKRFISSVRCLSFLTPQWKERYLILMGRYLYKFKSQNALEPKGTPFPVESIDVHFVTEASIGRSGSELEVQNLPPSCLAVFCVSSFRKKHYYAVSSREECLAWTNSLEQARQETIKKSMGHSHVPYPKTLEYFDELGKNLVRSKDRLKNKIEESQGREMEMSAINGGGPLPRGYYG